MINNKPLVSVIMSTYNGSKYISESIESVLSQTYKNFEFIIINDCSTDNVEDIILNHQKDDNRIIYIKNKENLKLTKSLNKWLKLAKWKYIARIDDDDIWVKKKLEKQVDFMEKNDDYWLCWTSTIIIDSKWKEIEKIKMRETDKEIKNNLLKSNQFTHSSIIIRKSILDKVWWFYNEYYNNWEDYELWLRIWTISKLYNLQEYLVKYRILKTSISRTKHFNQKKLAFLISLKYFNKYPNWFISIIINFIKLLIPQIIYEKILKIYLNIYHK